MGLPKPLNVGAEVIYIDSKGKEHRATLCHVSVVGQPPNVTLATRGDTRPRVHSAVPHRDSLVREDGRGYWMVP